MRFSIPQILEATKGKLLSGSSSKEILSISTDSRSLKKGDLFSVDVGAVLNGWHTDAAWSVIVGAGGTDPSPKVQDDFSLKNRFKTAQFQVFIF